MIQTLKRRLGEKQIDDTSTFELASHVAEIIKTLINTPQRVKKTSTFEAHMGRKPNTSHSKIKILVHQRLELGKRKTRLYRTEKFDATPTPARKNAQVKMLVRKRGEEKKKPLENPRTQHSKKRWERRPHNKKTRFEK